MKPTTKMLFFSIIALGMLSLAGCKKDKAEVKNEGRVVFWYNQETSKGLLEDDAVSLTYFIDGQVVGSSSTGVYWKGTGGPDCGQDGSITVTKDLGNASNLAAKYSVKDQTGFEYWEGVVNFSKNTCFALELVW